jgi:hypothetical protein
LLELLPRLIELRGGGKILFGILTLSKIRPSRDYAAILSLLHTCQVPGHNSDEHQVELLPGGGAKSLHCAIYMSAPAHSQNRDRT